MKLYSADLSTGNVQPFVTFASTRADWCWDMCGGQLTSGPVAFSNNEGIYRVDSGAEPTPLPNTGGTILNRCGAIAHHQHAIGKLDGFFDVVGNKKNRFLFTLPVSHQVVADFFVRKSFLKKLPSSWFVEMIP